MSIEFEIPKPILQSQFILKTVAEEMMRSKSRYFDEHEHEIPWDYIEFMHTAMKAMRVGSLAPKEKKAEGDEKEKRPNIVNRPASKCNALRTSCNTSERTDFKSNDWVDFEFNLRPRWHPQP